MSLSTPAQHREARSSSELPPSVNGLPSPDVLRHRHSLSAVHRQQVEQHRQAIADILGGRDPRLLAVVGPCSVHHVDDALEYADWLATQAHCFRDVLLIAMRVYTEKPRSTVGWRGLVYDPMLDGKLGPADGLSESRRVSTGVVARGLPVATEVLDPFVVPYLEDTLAFASIGARTCESQTHRQMAATLGCPVGIKNTTTGGVQAAADAAVAVGSAQSAFSLAPAGGVVIRESAGNRDSAIILRGGSAGPNFDIDTQAHARQLMAQRQLNDAVVIDCSHGNSGKVAAHQLDVVASLCEQMRRGVDRPAGVMIESNHHGGQQSAGPLNGLKRGVSVTDECLGQADTSAALEQLAETLRDTAGSTEQTRAGHSVLSLEV